MGKYQKLPATTNYRVSQVQFHDSNWISGKIENLCFLAKVFEKGSMFGINGGNVSKLSVWPEGGPEIISYDRGWDTKPKDAKGKRILDTLLNYCRDIYGKQEGLKQSAN